MREHPDWAVELVKDLVDLADPAHPNRAALAQLRRGLTGSADYALGRVGWLFRRVPEDALDQAVLAAGLFAWVRGACPHAEGVTFGAAFGAGLTPDEKQRREGRFIDLLDTDAEDLPYKLRQAVTLVARDGGALDWVRLVQDLGRWSRPSRRVQKEWARGFWAATSKDETAASTERSVPE